VDGLLLTSRFSRHYGAEFDIAEGVAVVSAKGCRYFTDSRYIESAENGIKGFEVLDIAGHGYGHSLGLEIHENPSPNARNAEGIPVHAVCSAEPGIYLPGRFGVRIEDVVIFTEDGCENITGSPKNLIIVGKN